MPVWVYMRFCGSFWAGESAVAFFSIELDLQYVDRSNY